MSDHVAQHDAEPLLEVKDLTVSFPGTGGHRLKASDRINLSIFPGQTLAVVGESGSGKSVTAMSVLQLIPHPPGRTEGGQILWRHRNDSGGNDATPTDLLKYNDKQMRRVRGNEVAMIFQEPMTSLNPVYTIGEQVLEAIRLHQDVTAEQAVATAESALRDVGIADPTARLREYPHQLSGGMRQRVMIAMALACQPDLLLADEPTTALDVTIQAQILELLRKLQDEKGMAVMLITHDLGVVAENADVVAVMFAGRIVEYTDVVTLFENPLHPYTRGLLGSMPVLGTRARRLGTVMDHAGVPENFPTGYKAFAHNPERVPGQVYGGESSHLHEIEPNHWVLCESLAQDGAKPPKAPRLNHRRKTAGV